MTGPIPPSAAEGEAELENDQKAATPPIGEARAAGRWSAAGMPVERSANFGASTRRLLRRMMWQRKKRKRPGHDRANRPPRRRRKNAPLVFGDG